MAVPAKTSRHPCRHFSILYSRIVFVRIIHQIITRFIFFIVCYDLQPHIAGTSEIVQ